MKKYIKIYLMLLRINFANIFAYRANFINGIISSFFWSSFIIISLVLLTSRTAHLFSWTRNELLLFAGVYNLIYSIFYLIFSWNFEEFSFNIHYGRLDSILLKPIDSQFFMSCKFIGYNNIIRFTVGLSFIFYMLSQMKVQLTPFAVLQFFFLLFFSISIIYSFWYMVLTLMIWFSKLSNLVDLLYSVNAVTRYPQEIYKNASPIFFIILFPLTLVVVTPVKALLYKFTIVDGVVLVGVSFFFIFLSHIFWQYALRFYTSASS